MKTDPMDNVDVEPISPPPRTGPGGSRQAWVSYAEALADANLSAFDLIRRQSDVIRSLQAEIERLDQRIAERKPKGGRPKIEAKRIAEIERDLAAGYSMRATAVRCGVSAMTVSRIAGGAVGKSPHAGFSRTGPLPHAEIFSGRRSSRARTKART